MLIYLYNKVLDYIIYIYIYSIFVSTIIIIMYFTFSALAKVLIRHLCECMLKCTSVRVIV